MLEDLIVGPASFRLVEVVHVELSDERREVVVLEVLRQDLLAEGVRILYCEAVTIGLGPRHDVVLRLVVDDLVQLDQEGWHVIDRCDRSVAIDVEVRPRAGGVDGGFTSTWCQWAWLLLYMYVGLVL